MNGNGTGSRAGATQCAIVVSAALAVCAILAGSSAFATEVVDQRGKRIALDGPARRAVLLPMPAASSYIAVDGTERNVVGMNPASASAMRDGILSRIFPATARIATDITRGGGVIPNVESILALRPDVVFQWATSGSEPLEVLDRAGLNVVGMRYGGQADMDGYGRVMGAVAGKAERAEELVAKQAGRRAEIEAALRDLPEERRPKVLYVGRYSDSIRAGGAGSYNDFYIRLAGGQNVAANMPGGGQAVTVEQVLTWDPGVILLGNFDSAQPADIYADPRWQNLSAVKAGRVYRMPLGGYRWDPPSQESALTWTWLAGLLQPDRTAMDLREDMRGWYRFLYGHELQDAEIDRILFVAENARSAGYERYRRP